MTEEEAAARRGYDLGKRLQSMDQTRQAVLQAARRQLEAEGYRQLTMPTLARQSGVTRQTIHNLFGSKSGVLQALFDTLALEAGMDRMREVMQRPDTQEKLKRFVEVFCLFWQKHRGLLRRIHGIGAIDPEVGALVEMRNRRRYAAAFRLTTQWTSGKAAQVAAAALSSLTSFEFYDAMLQSGTSAAQTRATIRELALTVLQKHTEEAGWGSAGRVERDPHRSSRQG